jgi:hypothetical protein
VPTFASGPLGAEQGASQTGLDRRGSGASQTRSRRAAERPGAPASGAKGCAPAATRSARRGWSRTGGSVCVSGMFLNKRARLRRSFVCLGRGSGQEAPRAGRESRSRGAVARGWGAISALQQLTPMGAGMFRHQDRGLQGTGVWAINPST